MKKRLKTVAVLIVFLTVFTVHSADKKLKIVFMFGQAEMVGNANITTTEYMIQKPLIPPREVTVNAHKAMQHQFNGAYLYWVAMNSYGGPKEKKEELKRLFKERGEFKAKFKQHVIDELNKNDGMFRGKKYTKRRGAYRGFWLFNLCDDECEKEGYTPKIRAILEGEDNAFNVEKAYEKLIEDINLRYEKQQELNKLFLNGATLESFAEYKKAVSKYYEGIQNKEVTMTLLRNAIAHNAAQYLKMPIAKRTYITAIGAVDGDVLEESDKVAKGRLSVGYGANVQTIGPEYAAGLALENSLDGPILIIKYSWNQNRGTVSDLWSLTSPDPKKVAEATAKGDQVVATPVWENIRKHIKNVLADPGKYHPDYDKEAGYDISGLIWFQGLTERDNSEYGTQLAAMLKGFRKEMEKTDLPVVALTVGTMYFKGESDDLPVNQGMMSLKAIPEFKDSFDVVESYRWNPSEFGVLHGLFHKRKLNKKDAKCKVMAEMISRSTTGRAPYSGSASFYLMAGYDAGIKLAKMIKGK